MHTCCSYPQRLHGVGSSGAGVAGGGAAQCVQHWGPNAAPLEEQQVLLASASQSVYHSLKKVGQLSVEKNNFEHF
jgi:hypothetical protein